LSIRAEHAGVAALAVRWFSPMLCGTLCTLVLLGLIVGTTDWSIPEHVRSFDVLARTITVALLIGFLATLIGLPWAWLIGTGSARSFSVLAIAPLFLPSYLVYAAWSLARAPGTVLGDALVTAPISVLKFANSAQAVLGLALWVWPLASLIVATGVRSIGAESQDALRLSGASVVRRWLVVAQEIRGAIFVSVALIAVVMAGSAVPLHVAQVETYAIVLWRAIAEGATRDGLLMPALPMLVVSFFGALLAMRLVRPSRADAHTGSATHRSTIASTAAAWAVIALSLGVPIAMLVRALPQGQPFLAFVSLAGESLANSATIAVLVAVAAILIGLSSAFGQTSRSRFFTGFLWLALALVPGVLIGSAISRASTSFSSLDALGRTNAGLVLAHVARTGAIAWIAGAMFVVNEHRELSHARRVFWSGRLGSWLSSSGPGLWAVLFGVSIAAGLLSLHEIEAAVVVAPPGHQTFAQQMLGWLHYLRDDSLTTGALALMTLGLSLSLFAALLVRLGIRRTGRIASLVLVVLCVGMQYGCTDSGVDERGRISDAHVLGGVGRGDGLFIYPRAIDGNNGMLWIIDKTARIQQLNINGGFVRSWDMPSLDRGKPCGVTYGHDGKLYVADTHEQRVSIFDLSDADPAATMTSFGSYGEEPGQFVYPTDIALLYEDDGKTVRRVYVSEYGGNDRVSVFNAEHEFLFEFGVQGTPVDGQVRFRRPQSMLIDPRRSELIISDSGNHRIGRFTLDGEPIGWIGRAGGIAGDGPGEFSYPYGLCLAPDGTLLVSEFGNSRIQRIDLDTGACVGLYGTPGMLAGEITAPWGVACDGRTVIVLDSANNRVQHFALPERMSGL